MTGLRYAVGIDIGGTKIGVALVGIGGEILQAETFATEVAEGFGKAVERINEAISRMLSKQGIAKSQLAGIGVGCAGPVDAAKGRIQNGFTLPGWENQDIVTPLQQEFGCPSYLENDAAVALLGEYYYGAGQGADPLVMLTFGTGVGGAAFRQGVIWQGPNGQHPEIGHLIVDPAGPPCYCGMNGCLESVASGSALDAAAKKIGLNDARELFEESKRGEAQAKEITTRAANKVALAIWNLAHAFIPARIILGGGMMEEQFDHFYGAIRITLNKATQFDLSKLEVTTARLGNHAGVLGAASLVFEQRANQPSVD